MSPTKPGDGVSDPLPPPARPRCLSKVGYFGQGYFGKGYFDNKLQDCHTWDTGVLTVEWCPRELRDLGRKGIARLPPITVFRLMSAGDTRQILLDDSPYTYVGMLQRFRAKPLGVYHNLSRYLAYRHAYKNTQNLQGWARYTVLYRYRGENATVYRSISYREVGVPSETYRAKYITVYRSIHCRVCSGFYRTTRFLEHVYRYPACPMDPRHMGLQQQH